MRKWKEDAKADKHKRREDRQKLEDAKGIEELRSEQRQSAREDGSVPPGAV